MRKILLLPALIIASNSFCQVVSNVDWVRNYSERDQLENVPSAIDANNNVYITGYTVFGGTRDFTTIKYDASGTQQWVQHYNNIVGGDDRSNAVVVDATGNIYVTGQSQGTGTGFDYATVKYNAAGIQQWVARYNGTASGDDIAVAIVVDNSGNVYVTGRSKGTSSAMDYATVKYNSSGVQQWVSRYNGTANGDDGAVGIALGTGNRVYVTGTAKMTTTGLDAVTIRHNANNGNQMWVSSVNGSSNGSDAAYVLITDGNDVLVCGMVDNTSTQQDYLLAKINGNNGTTQFQKTYDSYGSSDFATALVKDAQNNYVVTGVARNTSSMEYHTVMYNNAGTYQWTNKRVINQSFNQVSPKIAVDFVDHFYVCGEVNNSNNIDMLLYQITPGGNTTWTETHNGTQNGNDVAVDLVMGNLGVIYLAGQTQNSNAKFDYTTIKYSQTPVVFPPDFNGEEGTPIFAFYENKGQLLKTNQQPANEVKYYAEMKDFISFIQNTKISLGFTKQDTIYDPTDTILDPADSIFRVDIDFIEANTNTKPYQFEEIAGERNYFLAHHPTGYADVKGYKRLLIPNIYPNIDLHIYNNSLGIKYYFVVKPGGNPNIIQHFFNGATSVNLNGSNQIEIMTPKGNAVLDQPTAYQVNFSLNIVPLASCDWTNVSGNTYKFQVPNYNPVLPLVIQVDQGNAAMPPSGNPTNNLCWSTYWGDLQNEYFREIKLDNSGNVYICGSSVSPMFPQAAGSIFPHVGLTDGVVIKLSPIMEPIWVNFIGGAESDEPYNIAIDESDGSVFIAGYSGSDNYPLANLNGGYQDNTNTGGINEGIISKFTVDGNTLEWSTYFGVDSEWDYLYDLAITNDGYLYVVGNGSVNSDFFPQAGAYNNNSGGALINKFDVLGNRFWTSSFGNGNFKSIELDNQNNLFLGGGSTGGFVTTPGAYDITPNGVSDLIVMKIDAATNNIDWSTYIGGNGDEGVEELAIDKANGLLYLVGKTANDISLTNTFPVIDNDLLNPDDFFQNNFQSTQISSNPNYYESDGFIVKLDANTGNPLWSTFFGGWESDICYGTFIDSDGFLYVTGTSMSGLLMSNPKLPFPPTDPFQYYVKSDVSPSPSVGGNDEDAFISVFTPNATLVWSTFFGRGSLSDVFSFDNIASVFVYQDQLFFAGYTYPSSSTTTLPIQEYDPTVGTSDYFQPFSSAGVEAMVGIFCMNNKLTLSVDDFTSSENPFYVSCFPNPFNNEIVVSFEYFGSNENILIDLFSIDGKLISSNKQQAISGENTFRINVDDIAKGIYILKIHGESINASAKLTKE